MKNKIIIFLLLLSIISLITVGMGFAAAVDPIKASISYSPQSVTGFDTIKLDITITNVGDSDMQQPVTLYTPDGKKVTEFGEDGSVKLSIGSSKTYTGEWKLKQSDLDKGEIKYYIKYSMLDDKGETVNQLKYLSASFEYKSTISDFQISRTVSPSVAKSGQEVSVEYSFVNNGTETISGIRVLENKSISKKAQTIKEIKPGESEKITFTKKMDKKNLTSSSKITYKVDNKSKSKSFEAQIIKYGESKINAVLSSEQKGTVIGQTLKLVLDLENKGTLDYTNITVNDDKLGEIATGETLLAGKKLKLEKDVIVNESTNYTFTITGTDPTGETVSLKTKKLEIKAIDETQQLSLNVSLSADSETVYTNSGKIRFTVIVSNESLGEAKKVKISHAGVPVYTFNSIAPGQTKSISREFMLSMSGKYQFTASCVDIIGETHDFLSNELYIDLISPTMVPVTVTQTPPPSLVTIAPKTWDDAPKTYEKTGKVFNAISIIFGILTMLVATVLGYALSLKLLAKYRSKKAVANIIEIKKGRDYLKESEDINTIKDEIDELAIEDFSLDSLTDNKSEITAEAKEDFIAPFADEENDVAIDSGTDTNDISDGTTGISAKTYKRRSPSDQL